MTTTDVPPEILGDVDDEPLTSGPTSWQEPIEPEVKTRRQRSDKGVPRGARGPNKRRATSLAKKLTSVVHMVAAGVATIDAFDSAIIAHNAEKLGNAWAPVVDQSPKLQQFFGNLERGGVWGTAILSTLAVALPIILHHNPDALPIPLKAVAMGMVPPDILAAMGAAQAGTNAASL